MVIHQNDNKYLEMYQIENIGGYGNHIRMKRRIRKSYQIKREMSSGNHVRTKDTSRKHIE